MDFAKALIDAGLREGAESEMESLNLDPVLFTFNVASDPKDGFTQLIDFDNRSTLRYGLGLSGESLPVLNCRFDNLDVLRIIADNHIYFGVQPIVVLGYPDSVDDVEFNNIMWKFERISYSSLMEGFKLQGKLKRSDIADLSVYEKEKSTYTRADGTVKDYDPEVSSEDDDEENDAF